MRLTRRGRILVTILTLIACAILWWWASSIPDLCLTRHGYMTCTNLAGGGA